MSSIPYISLIASFTVSSDSITLKLSIDTVLNSYANVTKDIVTTLLFWWC